jgi:hypothetical protein
MTNTYWKNEYESGWERFKSAMAADWEQTKHDFGSDTSRDLDQNVDDTVKQMAGKQPIPDAEREAAYRYGYSASLSHQNRAWDDTLNTELRGNYSGDYDRDLPYIRRAYDRQSASVLR